jgi:hypothetical protein
VFIFSDGYKALIADVGGRAVKRRRSRPLGYWDRGFESRSRHRCLSL